MLILYMGYEVCMKFSVEGIPFKNQIHSQLPWRGLLFQSFKQLLSFLLQLLADSGFLYDSSIVESVKTEEMKGKRVWPYRMDAGIPQNRHRIKKGTEKEERHQGLWEVPVWVLLHKGQRYCMGK